MVLVLYRIEEVRNGVWWSDENYNAFDAAELTQDNVKSVIFGDLLRILSSSLSMKELIRRYSFYAEFMGSLLPLTSPGHILPIASNNTLRLRLRPSISLPLGATPALIVQSMKISYEFVSCKVSRTRFRISSETTPNNTQPNNYMDASGNKPTRTNSSYDIGHSSSNNAPEESSNYSRFQEYNRQQTKTSQNNSQGASGLNTIVGDDTVTAISDAAEVAKEAAKSLFGFAATWGKTVLDAASTVSSSALSANTSRLSGPITLGKMKIQVTRELSEGGFGIVYVAQDGSKSYALKQLICQSKSQLEEARTEIENLQLLRGHPNIIELVDHGSAAPPNQPRQFYLLFPLYPVGTAWEAIERASIGIDPASRTGPPWPFPEQRAIRVLLCAANALEYMHRKGLCHRDVKPHNILLSDVSDDKHVLMDFGSVAPAKVNIETRSDALVVEDEASQKTSMAYRPPELMSAPFPPCTLDERIDVWSLGCTMFCLAFGRSPFETAKEGIQKLAILNGRWQAPSDLRMRDCSFRPEFVTLITDMLHLDWNCRPFMRDVVVRLQEML